MAIEFKNVYKSFPDKTVLENFSAVFPPGAVTTIMGPSGAGKTTLINILTGKLLPDRGNVSGLDSVKLSVVFQEDRLLPWTSALQNILFAMNGHEKRQEKILRARCLLGKLGLSDSTDKNVRLLSGGMKRRVSLARALAADYNTLILDEAFKGLDENTKKTTMAFVKEKSKNKCVINITHDMHEAEFMGGKIVRL